MCSGAARPANEHVFALPLNALLPVLHHRARAGLFLPLVFLHLTVSVR